MMPPGTENEPLTLGDLPLALETLWLAPGDLWLAPGGERQVPEDETLRFAGGTRQVGTPTSAPASFLCKGRQG